MRRDGGPVHHRAVDAPGRAARGCARPLESTISLYKTELIKPRGPWRSTADVELATAEWANWYNAKRLHSAIGHPPPDEHESTYYAQHQPPARWLESTAEVSTEPVAVQTWPADPV
jgi:transposase InsO family protein